MPLPSLPSPFLSRMESMLGPEFPAFLASYQKPRKQGLRVNTRKTTPEAFLRIFPFPLEPIPWVKNGFSYAPGLLPAQHPLYRCGLYYLQEPTAMAPAALLPIQPGDRVLDLCAAPGGKATELGCRLGGQGLLVANDASSARAKALLRNLELFGIPNVFVTNETPGRLAHAFPGFFHKILIDAPCSGEGMFRKEPAAVRNWTPGKPDACAKIQREILKQAIRMLSPGGLLMYSTCTFSAVENEGVVSHVLEQYPDIDLAQLPSIPGFSPGIPRWGNGDPRLLRCLRAWPHHCMGEGHFLALFQKSGATRDGQSGQISLPRAKKKGKVPHPQKFSPETRHLLEDFLQGIYGTLPPAWDWNLVEIRADKAYLLPSGLPPVKGFHFLRNGLFLGEVKKGRFEPSQPLALAYPDMPAVRLGLSSQDARVTAYLRGESISVSPRESTSPSGWMPLCADGFPLGWGKLVNGVFKNKYPTGWRCG